ncbi:DUF3237 domain-containing protein [Fictibacillus nanhaiensis]|uniref:DUF3237 domain-containing protein n=1 Tax=Fictibacillus nanhaiensis TaxID=742169 RepID=UPI00203EEABD|nr:DUF3237 domain-containing protein [Fictibacillus nanhaiensis]MCM3733834.1 DUF3237 domain-containing protein [Fictibacillus nanhaiensis]
MQTFSAPELTFLFNLSLKVDPPHFQEKTPVGKRRIINVASGTFEGEEIRGEVVPGGDDWITVREDGTIIQDVRITLRTDDGALILMTYRGIRTGPQSVLKRLDAGEEVDMTEYYFRTVPVFETASEKYDWLNRTVFICVGKRLPDGVQYSIYAVK